MTLTQKINCSKLAKLLDVTPRTIRNWATDSINPLPGIRVKGLWLFNIEQVQKWLEKQDIAIDIDTTVDEILNTINMEKNNESK